MAEMTAAEAIAWLTEDKAFGQECYSRKQIAALIEQQAQEIAKKDRMIDGLIKKVMAKCPDNEYITLIKCPNWDKQITPELCIACWLSWLEKEAEVQSA